MLSSLYFSSLLLLSVRLRIAAESACYPETFASFVLRISTFSTSALCRQCSERSSCSDASRPACGITTTSTCTKSADKDGMARERKLEDHERPVVGSVTNKVVCYYTNWSQYRSGHARFLPENINPSLCTHINFAFAQLTDGKLSPYEWNDAEMYTRVTTLRSASPTLKVLLAVGGWTHRSERFSLMASTATNRQRFISHALTYLRGNGFDGLDVDWEYPASAQTGGRPEDRENFVLFLQEMWTALEVEAESSGKSRMLLTLAVSAGKTTLEQGYDIPNIIKYVDFVNVMTYDLHGAWESFTGLNAPLYPRADEEGPDRTTNVDWAVTYWLSAGAPPGKLVLGLPSYGRTWTLSDVDKHGVGDVAVGAGQASTYTQTAGFLSYYEVCNCLKNGYTRQWESEQKAPYAYKNNQWVGYDDQDSIEEKVKYAIMKGLGGVMLWSLALDDFSGSFCNEGAYPILRILSNGVGISATGTQTGGTGTDGNGDSGNGETVDGTAPDTSPGNSPVVGPPSAQQGTECSSQQDFTCTSDGSFRDPSSCDHYYICQWVGNPTYERMTRRSCAWADTNLDLMAFDENLGVCVWRNQMKDHETLCRCG